MRRANTIRERTAVDCAVDCPTLGKVFAPITLHNNCSDDDMSQVTSQLSEVTTQPLNPFTASRSMCADDSRHTCAVLYYISVYCKFVSCEFDQLSGSCPASDAAYCVII